MESSLDEKDEIIVKLQKDLAALKELTNMKDEHIDSLAKRIKEINDASVQFEIQYQAEIAEMQSLVSHHSSAYEKEKKTNQQLLDTIEEMQKLLLDGQQAQNDLEEILTRATMESQKVIKFKDEVIKKLDDEITRLKAQAVAKIQEDLEGDVDHYYPSTSATQKVFKSNMSLSQIYNEYIVLQDKLDTSQTENYRLKEQLNQLIEEAEQKTPFIHQKVHESRKSLQTIKDLQIQLAKVTNEKDALFEEKENLIHTTNYLNREIARLEQTAQDLALQVRSLITTVYKAKGYELARQEDVPERETEESTANRIITQHLVTFDDITTLQVNNQRLIFSIRDLAAENEKLADQLKEKEQVSQQEMNKAFEEISKLTEERRQQAEMLSELMEAKSALKSIINSDESSRRSPGFNSKDTRMTMNDILNEMKESLRRIQDEASANKADYEQKMKELNDDINHYRQELTLIQAEKAKTENESEYIQEKMKLLQANFHLVKKEKSKLIESNSKLNCKLAKSEGKVAVLEKEIAEIKEIREKLEDNVIALQSERDSLRTNESLLTQERENLIKDYQEKIKLVSTLQKIQENFARLESEASKGLHLQLEKLEKESISLKSKLAEEEQKVKTMVQAHSKQISELQQKIDNELKKNAELRETNLLTESRLNVVESELKAIKSNAELDNPEKLREMDDKLAKAETNNKELKEENEQLKNKVNEREEKTKKLAMQARSRISALTQQKKTLEMEKETLTKRVGELETQISQTETQTNQHKILILTKRLEETEKLARSAASQAKTFKTENDNLNRINAELREKVDSLEDNAKKNSLRFKTLSSGSAIKLNRLKALEESQARMQAQQEQFEKFQAQLSSTQHSLSTTSSTVTTGSAAASTSGFVGTSSSNLPTPSSSSSSSTSSSTGLVRHPVLPQKQESPAPKPTPRASIRPLSVSRLPPISRSTTSTSGHVAVVAVQPNMENSAQLVPQATVAPTVVAAPAATAAASSSEPMSSSSSTSTSFSSIPLSSTAMSSSTPSPSPVASSPANSSSNNQPPISSSEATPQVERLSRPTEVIPSTRDNQSSELRITSSQGNSTLNQEPSVTTSDESGETSRQGLKRQRESPSPSTSRPQFQEDDASKKVRLEEPILIDQEMMYDAEQDISTHEQDDSIDESKESEINESSPDQLPAATSREVELENDYQQEEYIQHEQHTVSADSCDKNESEDESEHNDEEEEEEDEEEEAEEENDEQEQNQDEELAETGAEAEAKNEAEAEAASEEEAEVEIEAAEEEMEEDEEENEQEVELVEPEVKTEAEAEAVAKIEPETGAEAEARITDITETGPEAEAKIEDESETETRTEAEAEAKVESETEAEAKIEDESETETRIVAEAEAEIEDITETGPEAEAKIDNEPETESKTEAEVKIEDETDAETGAEAEAKMEDETQDETGAEAEAKIVSETEDETGVETEVKIEDKPEDVAEAEAKTESKVETASAKETSEDEEADEDDEEYEEEEEEEEDEEEEEEEEEDEEEDDEVEEVEIEDDDEVEEEDQDKSMALN